MSLVLKIPVDADSAFAYKLASLLDDIVKEDPGLIPEDNSASWYEHLVSKNAEGQVNAEAFVLVITPLERQQEGHDKWSTISRAVRDLLEADGETSPLLKGWSVGRPGFSENKVSHSDKR